MLESLTNNFSLLMVSLDMFQACYNSIRIVLDVKWALFTLHVRQFPGLFFIEIKLRPSAYGYYAI